MKVHIKVFLDRGRPIEQTKEVAGPNTLADAIIMKGLKVESDDATFTQRYPPHRIQLVETTILPEDKE